MNNNGIRSDFPILSTKARGYALVYLDNAASTQKPQAVIDRINHYYQNENANVHRGLHYLSDIATNAFEQARNIVANFIQADKNEVVWTKGTTESINLIANGLVSQIQPGDEILISHMEHHANIVPWQQLCERTGATLKAIGINKDYSLDLNQLDQLINDKTKIISIAHISNALGSIHDIQTIINKAKSVGAISIIDAAQSIAHLPIDVKQLDCDFLAFSGHKLFGPTGIGVLYGKYEQLNKLSVYQTGGEMIEKVSLTSGTSFHQAPFKFEAGTPNIVGAIGLGTAIEYLNHQDRDALLDHEKMLTNYCIDALKSISQVQLYANCNQQLGAISFNVKGAHPHDVGTLLDQQGICVRTGHHCAMPLMEHLNIPGTVRASVSIYNNTTDIDAFIQALHKTMTFL